MSRVGEGQSERGSQLVEYAVAVLAILLLGYLAYEYIPGVEQTVDMVVGEVNELVGLAPGIIELIARRIGEVGR